MTAFLYPAMQFLKTWISGGMIDSRYDQYSDEKIWRGNSFYSSEFIIQFLQARIEDGWFSSRYDQYVNEEIRRTDLPDGTIYTNTLKEQGWEAAEAALVEWNAEWRYSDYGALIQPVAEGMLMMAKADPQSVKMFDLNDNNRRVMRHYESRKGKAIVLINRSAPDCGCMEPEDTNVFGPRGQLGIKAIVLTLDNYQPAYTQLGVVLPICGNDWLQPERKKSGFTEVNIHLNGFMLGTTHIPDEEDSEYLMKMLGIAHGPIPRWHWSVDDFKGFPGTIDYLADNLPHLKEYFAALAETRTGNHQH